VSRAWAVTRTVVGAAVLVLVLWRVGTGDVLAALRRIGPVTVALAVLLAVDTTASAALRWTVVARDLGLQVPVREAFASCYRSQLLNSTLPGGVVGDVHRGVRHGRAAADVGLGLRSVAWERGAGQVVQALAVLAVLLLVPSPLRHVLLPLLALLAVTLLVVAVVTRRRWLGAFAPGTWLTVVACSAVAVAGHAATFVLAARSVGAAPVLQLVPLAFVVLLGMAVPVNLAGWGPREGVAAWAFASAGLGAAQGVAAAVVYGVLSLVAVLPGVTVLVADRLRGAT
jgi:uncharacterized membrane protein YbhN (UPF0104 family)